MTKPTVCVVDISTGQEVVREMTDAEYTQHLASIEASASTEVAE